MTGAEQTESETERADDAALDAVLCLGGPLHMKHRVPGPDVLTVVDKVQSWRLHRYMRVKLQLRNQSGALPIVLPVYAYDGAEG